MTTSDIAGLLGFAATAASLALAVLAEARARLARPTYGKFMRVYREN